METLASKVWLSLWFFSFNKRKTCLIQIVEIVFILHLICLQLHIIWSKFFFLFIGWEPTTWPANNCLQIMVCSCAMPSNCVWLQIIFCSCVKETVLFAFLRSLLPENGRLLRFPRIFIKKNKLGDRMIKQLLNSVIAKYRDLSVSRRSIICLSLRLRQIIDLLATDKSQYFAQPRPIIVNYFLPSGHYLIFTVTWRIPHRSLPSKCLCHVTFVEITSSLTYCQQVSDLHLHYVHLRSFNIRRYFI